MSRGVVKVRRRQPTPRDKLLPGRFNITVDMESRVPEGCYLATSSGGAVTDRESYFSALLSAADRYLKGEINEDYLVRLARSASASAERLERGFPRYSDGRPFIPGSSIKGAVRSRIEHMLKPFKAGGDLYSYSCYIVQEAGVVEALDGHVKLWGEEAVYPREPCRGFAACYVCDLFGNPNLASRVLISDAVMSRGRVKMLDDLQVEAAVPGSRFKLAVSGFNMSLLDLGLLLLGFGVLDGKGVLMGLYKYRFNPDVDGNPYHGRFVFGRLVFEVTGFSEHLTDAFEGLTVSQLVKAAGQELTERNLWSASREGDVG